MFGLYYFIMRKIVIINGPNLNLVGTRESNIYGLKPMDDYIHELQAQYADTVIIDYRQSNVEGEIVNFIQQACDSDGIILNAGGYTHTSVAIADAVAAVSVPTVEVHISNILAREEERRFSLLSKAVRGSVIGFGINGYEIALNALLKL